MTAARASLLADPEFRSTYITSGNSGLTDPAGLPVNCEWLKLEAKPTRERLIGCAGDRLFLADTGSLPSERGGAQRLTRRPFVTVTLGYIFLGKGRAAPAAPPAQPVT